MIKSNVLFPRARSHRKVNQTNNLRPVQDSGSLAVFKVTARNQGHYKGRSGAFVTYCNISCSIPMMAESKKGQNFAILGPTEKNIHSLIFCTDATYNISRFYTNWFLRYIRHFIFTKRGITPAAFDALCLKFNLHIFIWSGCCIPNINSIS